MALYHHFPGTIFVLQIDRTQPVPGGASPTASVAFSLVCPQKSAIKILHQPPTSIPMPTPHLYCHPHFHLYVLMPTSRKVLTLPMCPLSPLGVHSEKLHINPPSSVLPRKLIGNSHKLPNYFLWRHIEQSYFLFLHTLLPNATSPSNK